MARFHLLKVKDVKRETPEAVSVAFEVPPQQQPEYLFKMGQYITLKFKVDGEEIRRSYSLCTAPHEMELRVAVKAVQGGKGSEFINRNLKLGDSVEVMTPMGTFNTVLKGANKKHYVLFAGGSGITPMMSIIKSVLYVEKQSTITLFYGNNDEASIIFKKQIETILAANADRVKLYHIINVAPANHPVLLQGMMTKEKVLSLIENYVGLNNDNEFFVCGPTIMMDNVKAALQAVSKPKEVSICSFLRSPSIVLGQPITCTPAPIAL